MVMKRVVCGNKKAPQVTTRLLVTFEGAESQKETLHQLKKQGAVELLLGGGSRRPLRNYANDGERRYDF